MLNVVGLARRAAAIIPLAAILLAGCGDSTGPEDTVNGRWTGSSTGSVAMTLTVTLSQSGTTVIGNGSIVGTVDSWAVTVTGTFVKPDLAIIMKAQGFEDLNFTATMGDELLVGRLNGSGFQNLAFYLGRSP